MGGQNTKSKSVELIINHPIFQQAKLIVEQQRRIQIMLGCSQKQFQNWVQLQQRKIYPEYLMLPLSWSYSTQAICGDTGLAQITYDDYPYLLSEEIYNRRGYKKGFDQCDLWYLLYALVLAKKDVRNFSKKLGDVRPQNGKSRLPTLQAGQEHVTTQSAFFEGHITYLAPEQIENIDNPNSKQIDLESAQLFSIGLTLLSAGTLTQLSYLYGSKGRKFDFKTASSKIHEWISNSSYSEILRATVSNLCQFNPSTRMSGQQLYQWVQNYKGKIKAKSDFIVNQAPMKLHNQVKSLRMALGLIGAQMIQSRKDIAQSEVKYFQRFQNASGSKQASSDIQFAKRE